MSSGGTNAIFADIYLASGTIATGALLDLVRKHGYDSAVVLVVSIEGSELPPSTFAPHHVRRGLSLQLRLRPALPFQAPTLKHFAHRLRHGDS